MILALAVAIFTGRWRSTPDPAPLVDTLFPRASSFEGTNGVYSVVDEKGDLLGWIGTGSSPGYGGPMQVALAIGLPERIPGAQVIDSPQAAGLG